MTDSPDKPPFERHRAYYMVLKLVLLAIALGLTLRYLFG